MNYQNNMNDVKYELFKLALSKSEDEIKNAVDVTKNLLHFLEVETPVEVKNQRPIIDVINEKIESDKTLKDPLVKEYNRHLLVSNFINNELKVGIEKLCLDIDKKLGVSPSKEQCSDKLVEILMNSLEVYGNECVVSSKGYESDFVEKPKTTEPKPKTILTGIEEKDKKILTELLEKYEGDIEAAKDNIHNHKKPAFFHNDYPPGQFTKKVLRPQNIEPVKIFKTDVAEKEVFSKITDIVETI